MAMQLAQLRAELAPLEQRGDSAALLTKATDLLPSVADSSSESAHLHYCIGKALVGLARYGDAIGLAFQVVDDILDVTADSATLGKTAGKDAAQDKPTYVSLMGLERSRAYAASLFDDAVSALAASGLPDTRALHALAEMVIRRAH